MNLPLAIEQARYAVTIADRPLEALHVKLAAIISTVEAFRKLPRYADMNFATGALITDLFELMDDDSWVSERRLRTSVPAIGNDLDARTAARELEFIETLKADLRHFEDLTEEAMGWCPRHPELESFRDRLKGIRELAPFWDYEEPLKTRIEEWDGR